MQGKDDTIAGGKLYIVAERFKQRKAALKGRLDCRDETIANVLCVQVRQYQNYISGKKPIPVDRLKMLCLYMNVIPEWLTGEKDRFATLRGLGNEMMQDSMEAYRIEEKLIDYLIAAGIQSDRYDGELLSNDIYDPETGEPIEIGKLDTTTGGSENPYFKYREVQGVVLSYNEYQALLNELQQVIRFTADRFVNIAGLSRNRFEPAMWLNLDEIPEKNELEEWSRNQSVYE